MNNKLTNCFKIKELSWLEKTFNFAVANLNGARSPSAILVDSKKGVGNNIFVNLLAKSLLCNENKSSKESTTACDHCKSCLWFEEGYHPDFLLLQSEEKDKPIKIDQIRLVNTFFQTTTQNNRKIALIKNADLMNINAANALLKILEEPPKNSLIILSTSQAHRLPITILSRLQKIKLPSPNYDQALNFLLKKECLEKSNIQFSSILNLVNNSPLTALKWYQNDTLSQALKIIDELIIAIKDTGTFSKCAELISKESEFSLPLISYWLSDALKLKINPNETQIYFPNYRSKLIDTHKEHSLIQLNEQYNRLVDIYQRIKTPIKLNWLIEQWLINFER